jgi:DNA-binding MarR family transcriptional regulator
MSRVEVRKVAAALQVGMVLLKRRAGETVGDGTMTVPELRTLYKIHRLGPTTTAELARREGITPQAMGNTVAALDRRGLTSRTPDPLDKRRSLLSLTDEGQRAVDSGSGAFTDRIADALAVSFTESEIEALRIAAPLIERLAQQM